MFLVQKEVTDIEHDLQRNVHFDRCMTISLVPRYTGLGLSQTRLSISGVASTEFDFLASIELESQ